MAKEMLESFGLSKIYTDGPKKVKAVMDVRLSANRGEILAIVGPSGAGKSTLLQLLGGLDIPTKGNVVLDGIDLYSISDNARTKIRNEKVGFVFQFYHLLPELTALENVMLPMMIGGRSKMESKGKASGLLETVGLSERLGHKPGRLSGGEAQRVAIARALVNEPDVVFCDEPTGNLDSHMSGDIRGLIRRLSRENKKTFVIATHEDTLARKADRIVRICDGKLV
jgi:lipoprotein-releasing system ATP-binding protein